MRSCRTVWLLALVSSLARADLYPPLEQVWHLDVEGGCYMTPTVYKDWVFVGGLDKKIYALDKLTGTVRWEYETGGMVYGGIATDGAVVVASADDGKLYCLDATRGALRWEKQVDETLYSTPVIAGRSIFIGGGKAGMVFAFGLDDGAEQWVYDLGDRMGSGLVHDGGVLFVPSYDGRLHAVNANDGTSAWTFEAGATVDSMPLVAGDRVYVKLPNDTVHALDAANGALVWTAQAEQAPAAGQGPTNWSPLVLHEGLLMYGSLDGRVHALSAETGQPAWATEPGTARACPPAPAGAIGWAGGKDGVLSAFDLKTGEQVDRVVTATGGDTTQLLAGMMWPPAIVDDMLFVSSIQGGLYAYRGEPDGTVWRTMRERTREVAEALAPAVAGGPTPTPEELLTLQAFGARHRGFVVWESRRGGGWDLYRINLDGTGFTQLTHLAKPNDPLAWVSYLRPQVSPDGRTVQFAYGRRGGAAETWTVPSTGGDAVKVADGHPLRWSDGGKSVLFARDRRVWQLDLVSGQEAPLNDIEIPAFDSGMVGDVTTDLSAVVLRTPRANEFFPFEAGRTIKQLGGCEPQFTADGRYVYWVQGPKDFRIWQIGTEEERQLLGQPPTEPYNYTYFPTMTPDGRLLAYGASPGQHSHDTGDYEIYVTELDGQQATGQPVRYSWNPATDRWPYVWTEN